MHHMEHGIGLEFCGCDICLHILLGEEYGIIKPSFAVLERGKKRKRIEEIKQFFRISYCIFERGGDFVGEGR